MDIENLVNEYGDRLFKYIYSMARNKEDSEDILQEVFVRILRVKNPTKIEDVQSYLYRTSYHCTVEYINKRNKNSFIKLFKDKIPSAEDEVLQNHLDPILEKGLKQLNDKEKTIFLLRVLEDMPYVEIAKIVNLKESTTRKKHERARKKISRIFKIKGEEYYGYEKY